MQTPYATVDDITFTSPLASDSPMKSPAQTALSPTSLELNEFYHQLNSAHPNAAILSIVPGYSDAFVPQLRLSALPPLMTLYYSADNMDLCFSNLTEQCNIVFDSLCVTPDQALNLEKQTREQTKGTNKELAELQPPNSSKHQSSINIRSS